jgi:thiol-disulfide isomerase/thioredoxin
MTETIIMFIGKGCPSCSLINPVVDRLAEENDVAVEKFEVWNNPENEKLHKKFSDLLTAKYGRDTIVPAFVKPSKKMVLCDPSYDELKAFFMAG